MAVDINGLIQGYANTGASEVNAGAIGTIAPYVSHLSGPVAPLQQYNAASTTGSSQSGLQKFGHFLGGLASGVGNLAEGAAKLVGTSLAHAVTSVPREIAGIQHGFADRSQINWNNQRAQQNSQQLTSLNNSYKSGQISKAQYQDGLKGLIADNNKLTEDERNLISKTNTDKQNAYNAMIDSVAAVTTILTAGFGDISFLPASLAEKGAAEYLASAAPKAMLDNVESGLKQFAVSPEAFGKLSTGMQTALQKATAEVVASASTSMTSSQIARTAAVNLALKYPFYYTYLSGTGGQLYHELDQGKYGAARNTLGFNLALMVSGGPIGYAMKYGGKALEGLGGAMFGRNTFVDSLSKGIGDGSPQKLYDAITKTTDFGQYKFFDKTGQITTLPTEEARTRVIQNIKALRATNLGAVVGKDEAAAAQRVLNGMAAYEGTSMTDFTHEEALINMSNFSEAQRAGDFYGQKAGLKGITVGRVDVRDKNNIFTNIAPTISENKDAAHNMLDALIAENQTKAFANNDNFISQVRGLINKYHTPEDFSAAGQRIKAQTEVSDGFPEGVAKQLSSMGYIPIKPSKLEAPFKEGSTDKITSEFAHNDNFFKKTVAPFPVLSHVGTALTMAGLSPQTSEALTYQMYNGALANRLKGLDFLSTGAFKGDSEEHIADNVVKQLKDWTNQLNAHEVERGGVNLMGAKIRPPITDIRQMTTKDIATALEVSNSQAKQVGQALRNAMLDVPLAVRGLGDKVVDAASNVPLFRSYLRVQGAGRFAWNPVFSGKLIAKTEAASQGLSGGKVPVMFENILGRGPAIESTRSLLRDAGTFEKASAHFGEVAGGSEAVNDGTALGANLTHKLLPMQERSIAGMVNKMADKVNMTPSQFMEYFPTEVRDTTQLIAQYDRNSAFLHSPLVRTLNFAFFPFRFEYKVASIMAKSLAQTDTLTQVAVINGLMNAHNWLNSPDGMAWYQQNSSVIKLFNYFTPTTTLSTVGRMLSGLSHEDWRTTVGAWELGGLPFGWIPQILNDEGVNLTPGYVNPQTGEPLPKQIPNSSKAQLQTALGDLIGSLFTYPGTEVGLTSKTQVDKFIGGALTGGQAKKSEFTPTAPYLGAQQQQYSQDIQASNQKPGQTQQPVQTPDSTTVPIQGSGYAPPVYKNGAPKVPAARKLKKGQFKASLPV